MAAIGHSGSKAKAVDLHYAALTAATRATDVRCDPLTADSDLTNIHSACQALGRALGALSEYRADSVQMNAATKKQRTALQGQLAFPSPQLKEAFKAHLRAEAAQAGGGLVEMAVEGELAVRRKNIALALIQAAAAPAYVKLKDFLRRVRADFPDAWVASCGALLDKANAALETQQGIIPQIVKEKWQTALVEAHGGTCIIKSTPTHLLAEANGRQRFIKGQHLYKFTLGTAWSVDLAPLVARQ